MMRRPRPGPDEIEPTGPGQESVWDYPRPPDVRAVDARVTVRFAGVVLADTTRAVKVCETASPPTYYVPPEDVAFEFLEPSARRTICEWKGPARYYDAVVGDRVARDAVWTYPEPWRGFEGIAGWLSFMPAAMEECRVGEHVVEPQAGGFYGGWVTPNVTGPFKGPPGTGHW